MKNSLVKLFGFNATLIQGDFLVLDRWKWLSHQLKFAPRGKLLDVGSGSGAFSIGSSLRYNYNVLGLSWDNRNLLVSEDRAKICKVSETVVFDICDVRQLDLRKDLLEEFDVVICTENIEHIINDVKLVKDIAGAMKKGGLLLLTTPNFNYRPMGIGDDKENLSLQEDGGHVRIGYTPEDCISVAKKANLTVVSIEFCSGFFSQKFTTVLRFLTIYLTYYPAWIITFPFRIIPLMFDKIIERFFNWPGYSICMVAKKN
jgi:SAM-dependent methyltransferase